MRQKPMPAEKKCPDCGQTLPNTHEYYHRAENGRTTTYCKECAKVRARAHYRTHTEDHKAKVQAYYRDHQGWYRQWAKDNQSRRRAQLLQRRADDPQKFRTAYWHARQRRRGVPADQTAQEYRAVLLNDPCCYCGKSIERVEADHIVPVVAGGKTTWDNLTAACHDCNTAKRDKSLLDFLMARTVA